MNRLLLAVKSHSTTWSSTGWIIILTIAWGGNGFYRWTEKGVDEENHFRGRCFSHSKNIHSPSQGNIFSLPEKMDIERLRTEADEIVNGKVKLFWRRCR
jgi:hypothetical protein